MNVLLKSSHTCLFTASLIAAASFDVSGTTAVLQLKLTF